MAGADSIVLAVCYSMLTKSSQTVKYYIILKIEEGGGLSF